MDEHSHYEAIFRPLQFAGGHEDSFLSSLFRRIEEGDVNLDPEYQRGHVWTPEQQARFMGHVLEGGALPPIIMRRHSSWSEKPDEVLDGKQRLTALAAWMRGDVDAELTDGSTLNINDLSERDRRLFTSLSGPHFSIYYGHWSDAETLRIYIKLNRGGTVHTDEEIDRVRDMLTKLEEDER